MLTWCNMYVPCMCSIQVMPAVHITNNEFASHTQDPSHCLSSIFNLQMTQVVQLMHVSIALVNPQNFYVSGSIPKTSM